MPGESKSSRAEVYRKIKKASPEMPPTRGLEHLIELMLVIGPGMSGAMGMVALDFKEISAFDKIGVISNNDRIIIRDLSRAYVGQSNISTKADCLAPWVKGVDDIETHNMLKTMSDIAQQANAGKGKRPMSERPIKRG